MNPADWGIAPIQASTMADRVDTLFYFISAVSILVTLLVVGMVFYFCLRYRRAGAPRQDYVGQALSHEDTKKLEVTWIVIPLIVFMGMFVWSAKIYASIYTPPENSLNVYVVGKQWMWKLQHIDGKREINELHVPKGRAVKLIMTSEDVIHDFYVPAFRVKADVIPGRYTNIWFNATRVGEYHLFCAEYCGTRHSKMIGKVVVMEPRDYQEWLAGGKTESLAAAGERLFKKLQCTGCHNDKKDARGPQLRDLFGSTVRLIGGSTVVANEAYIRESILLPKAKYVVGYPGGTMPSFTAQVNEENVIQLIAYIKTLKTKGSAKHGESK